MSANPKGYGIKAPSIFARMFPEFDIVFGFMIDFFHKLELVGITFSSLALSVFQSFIFIFIFILAVELPWNHLEGLHSRQA